MNTNNNDIIIGDILYEYKKNLKKIFVDCEKVYYTDTYNYKNNFFSLENIKLNKNEKTYKTIFIKLVGYGDYELSIYKINKPNIYITDLMKKIESKQIIKQYNQNKSFIPQTFEKMCELLNIGIEAYLDNECSKEQKIVIENNFVFDISYEKINLYKLTFRNIFCHKYLDIVNYKIIGDGNFSLGVFEFIDSYYIIDYQTS